MQRTLRRCNDDQAIFPMYSFSACACFFGYPLHADYYAFTDRADFEVFRVSTGELTFENLATGTVLPTGAMIDGIKLSYDFAGRQLSATDSFSAPSGNISLGTNDGGNSLQDMDGIRFDFAPVSGFGLYIIGNAVDFRDGDIKLTVDGTTASLDTQKLQPIQLTDGGSAYFLGIQSDLGSRFTSAVLSSNSGSNSPAFVFNIDSIVTAITSVPEPSSLLLVLFCISFCNYRCRRDN